MLRVEIFEERDTCTPSGNPLVQSNPEKLAALLGGTPDSALLSGWQEFRREEFA
jgi:hypothetical protein